MTFEYKDSYMLQDDQVRLFTSVFKGRQDVYAKRWETNDKSGYAPAYDINWNHYELHKANGGTIKDYPYKSYSVVTDIAIKRHLEGRDVVGIYPLLENNTSWFVAVDFDENNWREEITKLYNLCTANQLPAYIERSRSGNGGHLWLFFNQPYPAVKSRAIIKCFLIQLGIKAGSNSSFDRVFPNQDYHSGKGLGNLIALPLQPNAMKYGNSVFVNPETFEQYTDQCEFLRSIVQINIQELEKLRDRLCTGISTLERPSASIGSGNLHILLDNTIVISRDNLSSDLVNFLRSSLKVSNQNFFIKKASGQSTFGTTASTTLLEEHTDSLVVPRGYIGPLLSYCKSAKIKYSLTDKRVKVHEIDFKTIGRLYEYQQQVLSTTEKKEMGVIVAPPGSGKTIIGLSIIVQKRQRALIIVHRRQLFDQWLQQIQSFLGIPIYRIGRIVNGRFDIGEHVTVGMIQSMENENAISKIGRSFGTIIIDECHHISAQSYRSVLRQLHTYYTYGLTATPVRKNKDEKFVFAQIGEIIHDVDTPHDSIEKGLSINIINTDLNVPFNADTDNYETLSNILTHDTARNSLITDDVRNEINNGRSIIILTERKDHLKVLNQFLKQECETVVLSGDDNELTRKAKIRQVRDGRFQVLITTGQLMGEGLDIEMLDCLFIVYPCSFEGKLVQYIGRVERSVNAPVIYDYRDLLVPYLEKMFQKRNKLYNKLCDSNKVALHEEYLLRFDNDLFFFGNYVHPYPISILDLGLNLEGFKTNTVWHIKVLKYNEDQTSIFAEILNYNASIHEEPQQLTIPFPPITQIRFRTLDTAGLLKSVVLRKTLLQDAKATVLPDLNVIYKETNGELSNQNTSAAARMTQVEQWWLFEKTTKVSFKKIRFGNGIITFPFYLSAIRKDIIIEIANPDVRTEFEVVKDYFPRILKVKSLTVNLTIKHNKRSVLSCEAFSDDVDAINSEVIDSVRFEFVRKDLPRFKGYTEKIIQTFDELKKGNSQVGSLLDSETELLSELLKMESAKHFLQLKYLANKHDANILRLRFILQPFSFIFLVTGENKYHLIWETLDSEEATYIWHIDRNKEALRTAIAEIEKALGEMKQSGRNSYIKCAPANFSRVIHDYSNPRKGFIEWKATLEERLI